MKKLIIALAIGLFVTGCAKKPENKPICKNGVCSLESGKNTTRSSHKSDAGQTDVIEVTGENFDAVVLQASKPVIIDFYATWCGPCKAMKPIYEELVEEQCDWIFATVDVDKAPDLAVRCGVKAMPTFVVFKNGTQWSSVVGARAKDQFAAELAAIVSAVEPISAVQSEQTNELMQRIAEKNIDEIKKLIDEGVNVNIPMKMSLGDVYPLQTAVIAGTKEIIDMLLDAGAVTHSNFEALVRKSLEMSAEPADKIRNGFLYAQELEQAFSKPAKDSGVKLVGSGIAQQLVAVMANPIELEKLIDAGADVNEIFSASGLEFTPLYIALITSNRQAIELLVNAGATLKKEIIVEPNGQKKTTEQAIKDMLDTYDQALVNSYNNLAYVLNKNLEV